MKKNSRKDFLKAGLLVGGAVYATPAAALASTGGRPFMGNEFGPDVSELPKKTQIGKLVPNLGDNTGALTLADLAGIAETNLKVINKIAPQFSAVTFNDLGSIVSYEIYKQGGDTPIFQKVSGDGWKISCSCCSCCCFS